MKYLVGLIVTPLILFSGQAFSMTKQDLRAQYAPNDTAIFIKKYSNRLNLKISGSDSEQVAAELQWLGQYQKDWQQYCAGRLVGAQAALDKIDHDDADDAVWKRSLQMQKYACAEWSSYLDSQNQKYMKFAKNPNFDFVTLKKTFASDMPIESVFSKAIQSNMILSFLSDGWDIPGKPKIDEYEPYRVGNKIAATNGNQLVGEIISGNATYQLIALGNNDNKWGLDFLRYLSGDELKRSASLSFRNVPLEVKQEEVKSALDEKSTLYWGAKPMMTTSLSVNEFVVTGLDAVPLKEPSLLVSITSGGNGCSSQKIFVMGVDSSGKRTITPEFGTCKDKVFTIATQDRAYFILGPDDEAPQVAVLQRK
jgi:hypothetical protein